VAEVSAGRPVVVVDDECPNNEGDLVFAAGMATRELVEFTRVHTSGYICVALPDSDCDRLDLPPMYHTNQGKRGTAYAVTIDAREDVTTGISSADRARTMRWLADPDAKAGDFTRPGHVVPLRARQGGVLLRPGHTEAAVDLVRAAGLTPAGVLCRIISHEVRGEVAARAELDTFAAEYGLTVVTVVDLVAYQLRSEKRVTQVAEARILSVHGNFCAHGFDSLLDGVEHVALVMGNLGDGTDVLVRVQSECLAGDVLGSLGCNCGAQLAAAMDAVAAEGRGVVVYVRRRDGHGIGLMHKLRCHRPRDSGADILDVNLAEALPADARDYGIGSQILVDLGVRSVRLLTDDVTKRVGLEGYGVEMLGQAPLLA
jgi:3,4-dihydroxy 2-butanone 4-phosphate synthase/GTP cyclohydrolase II